MPFAQAEIAKVLLKVKGSIESRVIVSNALIHKDLEVPEWCLPTMSPNALTTLPHPDPGSLYHFLFWTFDGHPNPGDPGAPDVDIPPMGFDCVHRAVKWYYVGGGPGDKVSRFFMWAFNMETGSFAAESPVAAPPEAAGQNHVVTQNQGWTIVAKESIGNGNLAQPFHHWWSTNASSPQAQYDKNLVLAPDVGGSAIAFYGQDTVDAPKPPDHGGITFKRTKDALAEIKGSSYDFTDLFDFSIYERLVERIDRLEQQVHRGQSFIRGAERPPVSGPGPRGPVSGPGACGPVDK
ncbi:MAG: hypothetical protein O6951_05315 [Actinobacteria bacterium]|nr:hypothetical protein [Actinomycetota bacterium]